MILVVEFTQHHDALGALFAGEEMEVEQYPGKFGVRIENTVLISDYMSTEFGKFLQIGRLF